MSFAALNAYKCLPWETCCSASQRFRDGEAVPSAHLDELMVLSEDPLHKRHCKPIKGNVQCKAWWRKGHLPRFSKRNDSTWNGGHCLQRGWGWH